MAKIFIVAGLVLVGIGVLIKIGAPIGRLPGDIVIERGGSTIYIPIVTCLVLSLVLSALAMLLRR
jgi:uncharacterized membrane protein YczE